MRRIILCIALGISLLLVLVPVSFAVTRSFVVSASVPRATGVGINAFKVDSATNAFTPVAGTNLSFDPMVFNTANGIYLPDHYFAIDVAAIGGAGSPDVTVAYSEGANPNSPGKGLGWKSTSTFVKVTGPTGSQTETGLTAHGPKKLLKDLIGEFINDTEITGGFLRIYIGVVTHDPAQRFPDPGSGVPFTNGDNPGTYDGTLVISATVA